MFFSVSSVKFHSRSFSRGLSIGLQERDKVGVSVLFTNEPIPYHLDVHGIKVPGSDVASKFTISVFALIEGHNMKRNTIEKNIGSGLSILECQKNT